MKKKHIILAIVNMYPPLSIESRKGRGRKNHTSKQRNPSPGSADVHFGVVDVVRRTVRAEGNIRVPVRK